MNDDTPANIIRDAFLKESLQTLHSGGRATQIGSTNRILIEAAADGLVAALKKFDEIAILNRRRWGS